MIPCRSHRSRPARGFLFDSPRPGVLVFLLAALATPISATTDDVPVPDQPSSAEASSPSLASPSAGLVDDGTRIYRLPVSADQLDRLRSWTSGGHGESHSAAGSPFELGVAEFWAYLPRESVAILRLDDLARDRLEQLGHRPELDLERTRAARETAETFARRRSEAGPGASAQKGGGIPGFGCYRTVDETFASLSGLAASQPEVLSWIDIGNSWEKNAGLGGDDIWLAKVGTGASGQPDPPKLVIIGAMHARELATAEVVTRFVELLVAGYGVDPDITWLLDHFEVHAIAQLNPDGRRRAETGLSWRKNTNNDFCSNTDSRGIDLNRNSTFFWGGPASSGGACSDIYRGPSAASEPETAAIEDYLAQIFPDRKGDMEQPAPSDVEGLFLSYHSFGELVLFPWEGTNADGPNHAQLETLGRKLGFYTDYSVCQDCLGTASGTTVDQAYGEYGVPSYTLEIGTNFFQDCASFESTIAPDNLESLLYAAKATRRPYEEPAGPEVLSIELSSASVAAGEPVTLTALADDTRYDSNGFGAEPIQNVAGAEVFVARAGAGGEAPWTGVGVAMAAQDGLFDSSSEALVHTLSTQGLEEGRYLVYVVAEDENGQRGVPSAAFLDISEPAAIFADGFESGSISSWVD